MSGRQTFPARRGKLSTGGVCMAESKKNPDRIQESIEGLVKEIKAGKPLKEVSKIEWEALLKYYRTQAEVARKLERPRTTIKEHYVKRGIFNSDFPWARTKVEVKPSSAEKLQEFLKKHRDERYTVVELANELDCSPQTIEQWAEQLKQDGFVIEFEKEEISSPKESSPGGYKYVPSKGTDFIFGALGDTHFGSMWQLPVQEFLESVFDFYKSEGVEKVLHTGDWLAGERVYRGQIRDLCVVGADHQIKSAVDNFPRRKGIQTIGITGNHDLSYWKDAGIDIGKRIAQARDDIKILGDTEVDYILKHESEAETRIRLFHPSKGTAYAISYNMQKVIESYTGGTKPHILLQGHTHKAEKLPSYRNVIGMQTGCLEEQTRFMKQQNIAAMIGAWLIEFSVDPNNGGVTKFTSTWIPYYHE